MANNKFLKGWEKNLIKMTGVKKPNLKRGGKGYETPIEFDQVEGYEEEKPSPEVPRMKTTKYKEGM